MSILAQVLKDLWGMFWADAWLSASILALVGLVAVLIGQGMLAPLNGGWLLLAGAVAILVGAVLRAAGR